MDKSDNYYSKFIQNKYRIPPLIPIPSIDVVNEKKMRKINVKKSVKKIMKSSRVHRNDFEVDVLFKPKLPKSFYIIKLGEWAEEIPIIGLQPEWEFNIVKLISNTWRRKYPEYEQNLLEEVRDIYINRMQQLAVESTVLNYDKKLEDDVCETVVEPDYCSKNSYQILRFIKHRNALKNKYFLSHNLMRNIIAVSISVLVPQLIVNFSYYHAMGLMQLSEIRNIIKSDLRSGSLRINQKYYKEIADMISNFKSLQEISPNIMPQFMQCMINLFVQQLLHIMMYTIKHMISVLKYNKHCPQIYFELVLDNGLLKICPSIDEIENMYYEIIEDIEKIGQNLLLFKIGSINLCSDSSIDNYIRIKMPDWFIEESQNELKSIIINLYKPLNDYFWNVQNEFSFVCANETRESIEKLVAHNYNFNIYYEQVEKFDIYLKRANAITPVLYYSVGNLSQIQAKEDLKTNISDIIHILINKLTSYHVEYNISICEEYEKFKSKALNIPDNTADLFDLNDNMVSNSKNIVENLGQKISESGKMLIILLNITILTDDHMELNSKTINCLSSIKNIFSQSNTLCEAMKSELEDELQKKINTLNTSIDNIFPTLVILNDMDDANRVHEYIEYLNILVSNIKQIDAEIQAINMEEKLFKFPESAFPKIDDIKNIVLTFFSLTKMLHEWRRHRAAWLEGPFEYINASEVGKLIDFYSNEFTQFNKIMKTNIKSDMLSHKLFRFSGVVDDPDPMQQPAPMKLCFQALEQINECKQYVLLINCICNSALEQRHWDEMSAIYGSDITPDAGTTLLKFIGLNLLKDIDKYHVISISANKELELQQKLRNMHEQWKNVSFILTNDIYGKFIFTNFNEIQVRLDEHLTIIQEMKGSYFVKPITHHVDIYYKSLVQIRDIMHHFNIIQEDCLFLRPIFTCKETSIEKLVDVAVIFFQVEEIINSVIEDISRQPTFHNIGQSSNYLIKLLEAMEKIKMINDNVKVYLNDIRLFFPRFFFLSDNELVMILFKESVTEKLRLLLKKCISGVANVRVDSLKIPSIEVISEYNEHLLLKSNFLLSVEDGNEWMPLIETAITNAIREDILKCIDNHGKVIDYKSFFMKNFSLGITVECAIQLIWTSNIQQCFEKFHPEKLQSVLNIQNLLINTTLSDLKNALSIKDRTMLMSLVTVLFYQRNIINLLIEKNISNDKDFNWSAQLQYYWQDNDVKVNMLNDTNQYGYEFSTIGEPIINTLLTDRCYRTIIEAKRHHLFASLVGYDATGKTETIRGLTRALAVPFHIINCCKNLNYNQMSMILKGIISSGSWVCFKNINMVKLSVLSAITHHMHRISQMLCSECTLFSFDGSELIFKPGGFIVTTANYHRSRLLFYQDELPDNFRALFRSVAFCRPDISKICEARLFAAGFSNAKILAYKIRMIYNLCMENFSLEKKHEFGCRTLNALLRNAINLKFEFPNDNEYTIILRSLIDVNLSVFSNDDMNLFQGFINDIFTEVYLPPPNYTSLLKALAQVAKNKCIEVHTMFELKTIQILEMIYLRHVFMIIGDASCGKTTLLRTLAECLSLILRTHGADDKIGANIQLETINPISVTSDNLFGYLDEQTNKWHDGIYTTLISNHNENNGLSKLKKWIVFDGPVESMWMDNLNTILDNHSNKKLLLSTGETIEMSNAISVIIETDNIEEASPATVSRCGIIYLEQKEFTYKYYIKAWIVERQFENEHKKFMEILIQWSLKSCLDFIRRMCNFIGTVENMYLVIATLKLCTIYIKNAEENMDDKDKNNNFPIWCQAAVIQSIIWTFGAWLSTSSCVIFNEFCTSLWTNNEINNPLPEEIKQYELLLPSEGMIQDHTYIFKGAGFWKHWSDILKTESAIIQSYGFGYTFVPTIDTIKYIFMFNNQIKYRLPFIVCGDISTGKTSLMRYFLTNKLSSTEYMINFFNFTPSITVHQAQNLFLQKLNKTMKNYYTPPNNKYCINFIDDFNLNITNDCNTKNSVSELIRQYIDHAHWYSRNEPSKLFLNDIMFLCASTLNGGSKRRKIFCSRFIRHFNFYTIPTFSRENILKIFSNTLFNNLKKNLFSIDIIGSVNNIVNATIDVYTAISDKLKPIPLNIQYQFNIRDISKVIDGCSLIHKESVETKIILIRLWVHETMRVFGDRIINTNDSELLFSNIKTAIKAHFKENLESIFDYLPKKNNELTHESLKNLMFGNFMETEKDINNRRYEEIGSNQLLKNRIIHYFTEFNNSCEKKLDILLFSDVLEHLIRLCRVLCLPGGNLLMICTGGLGRKSITRLAAYIERQDFFQYNPNYYFNSLEWRETLKKAIKISGGAGKHCTFFISTRYIKHSYIEDISSLISTGEIPELISSDERQSIVEIARLPAQNGDRNLEISVADVMEFFFNQCREKLHFILYFNVFNCKNFRRQMQSFPSLLKYSYIDSFMPWPLDAFIQIGNKFIEDVSIEDTVKEKIIIASKYFYDESKKLSEKYCRKFGRSIHVTPSAFIHTVRLYGVQMCNKQQTITESRRKYLGGLQKLQSTAEEVINMQETLKALRPELENSAKRTEETMREIENENISVANATIQVKRDEEIANKTAKIAATLKLECETDLAVAIPILEDAIAALNTLKPSDITLVKAMKNPPDTVKLVMAAVCVMLDVPAERVIDPITGRKSMDFWGPSKRILGDMNFLQTLKDYDKDNIPPTLMQIIKKTYMTDKNFMPNIVTKASSAAEGLCKWVRAMVSYDDVAKIVAPKKEKLAAAEKECNESLAFLTEKRKTLVALNDKLTGLKTSLHSILEKKCLLENEVEICTEKLFKAEALITSFSDEKCKWLDSVEKLKESYDNLAGDILISCAIIAYLTPYHSAYRNENVALWINYIRSNLNIPCSKEYNFVKSLDSEMKSSFWYQHGLTKDYHYQENCVILNNSLQLCLFIDPESQATSLIKEIERQNKLIIIKSTDPNLLEIIVHGIELDQPVLVENFEDDEFSAQCIDCILSLMNDHFGDNYNCNKYHGRFRLYMTTKLDNPRFESYIFGNITVIDFQLTENAIQNKLMDIVISRERPKVHEKFDRLLDRSASNMRLLKQEEDNILTILSTSTANILQDDASIKILDSSKNLSVELLRKERNVNKAKHEIDIFRRSYNKFTHYCAILYYTLSPLSNLNCMYRFSFEWFIRIYIKSIDNSKKSAIIKTRLEYLMSSFTTTLNTSVLIVLSDKHKLLYSFLLCLKIQLYLEQVKSEEIEFFMTDNLNVVECDDDMAVKLNWLPRNLWQAVILLSKRISIFHNITMSIIDDESVWLNFYNSPNATIDSLPHQWCESLTPFQKLILVKIIRPDRLETQITRFVADILGESFGGIHSSQNLFQLYSESSCLTPLIFILPCYIEPVKQIQDFAATIGCISKLTMISLGNDHEERAIKAILKAQMEGGWILLENCHLASKWMLQLEKIYEGIDTTNTALEFRLWLTSAPSRQFPITILQDGLKLMCDVPSSLKQNLINCYHSYPLDKTDIFSSCPGKDKILSKLIYAFTFFHVFVKERNHFGIHGWNFNYNFCHSNLVISISQLLSFVRRNSSSINNTSFEELLYLVGECNYGGKFIDDVDNRCLMTLLREFCKIDIIMQNNYMIATNYYIPDRCERRDYIQHIKNLPDYSSPELFGIGENSMINRNINMIKDYFSQMSAINGQLIEDEIILQESVNAINIEILRNNLPKRLDIEKAEEIYCDHESLDGVLIHEIMIYNSILEFVEDSLVRPDEQLIHALTINKLPALWYSFPKFCQHQISFSKFIEKINAQYDFFNKWINDKCPVSFWLGNFASPGRFISVVRIIFSRHCGIPIDELLCDFEVLSTKDSDTLSIPDDKIVIYLQNLYLSGATWNFANRELMPNNPRVLSELMPIICWTPQLSVLKTSQNYSCPVYKSNIGRDLINYTGNSSNFIFHIPLSTNLPESYWIKRGTAIFCQLE